MDEGICLIKGVVSERGSICVVATLAADEEQGIAHSYVAAWNSKKWTIWDEDYDVSSVAAGKGEHVGTLVLLGMTGESTLVDSTGFKPLPIGKGNDAPNRLRTLHEVRAIGQHFYAVGMRRQVFRLPMAGGTWEKIDSGAFVSDSSREIAGFLSVDGFDDDDVYAVGYGGQIWHFDGAQWHQLSSPSNLRLECVRCSPDGQVLVCGAQGLVMQGRMDHWKVIEQNLVEEDLLSLAVLSNQVFLADESSSLLLWHGGDFSEVQPRKGEAISTGFLDTCGKYVVSIGESDIFLYDGKTWKAVPLPPIEK